MTKRTFLEFFAGGGFARMGLGEDWRCILANDWDDKKAEVYKSNWGKSDFIHDDIGSLSAKDIDAVTDLAWASFPCQDVSLAGAGAGLDGKRSGTFWPFWKIILGLIADEKAPSLIVLENVCGMITSRKGHDFDAICNAMAENGYKVGAIVVDAALFLPHSRQRVFVIGVRKELDVPSELLTETPKYFQSEPLRRIVGEKLSIDPRMWLNWNLTPPINEVGSLQTILEKDDSVKWDSHEQTCHLLNLMSSTTLKKLRHVRKDGATTIGTVYRRMRTNAQGAKVQRAEIRFDGIAGCLRSPSGGSSKQTVISVAGNDIRTRRLTGREALRLMGVPDHYKTHASENEIYRLAGEGVAVPVVRYLSRMLLEPIIDFNRVAKHENRI